MDAPCDLFWQHINAYDLDSYLKWERTKHVYDDDVDDDDDFNDDNYDDDDDEDTLPWFLPSSNLKREWKDWTISSDPFYKV